MNDRDKADELIQHLQECARTNTRPKVKDEEGVLVIETVLGTAEFPYEFDVTNQVWYLEG